MAASNRFAATINSCEILDTKKDIGLRLVFQSSSVMPKLIPKPTRITAAGNKPKLIDEYVGRINSADEAVSIAHMRSPGGWVEPGQTPEFDEYTVVLRGQLSVKHKNGVIEVNAGQAVITRAGEWIQYGSPTAEGAEYVAICLPAFSPQTVHRDE
jgi:mannose-6-phosphate isomerase-like protein (cupin superfamily)